MTDPNTVQPEDIETPVPTPVVEENDDELEPEVPDVAPPNETPEQKDARIAALTERNEKLWARLQRAKSKPASPAAPAPAAPAPAAPTAQPALSRDEAILIAQGFSVEEVEHAKKVAQLRKSPAARCRKERPLHDLEDQARQGGEGRCCAAPALPRWQAPRQEDLLLERSQ